MKALELTEKKAKKLYVEAPDWLKSELEETFGKEFFKEKEYEKIKTFVDACKKVGIDPNKVIYATDTPDEEAYKMLKIIAKAINGDWVPNWTNSDELKWFPYFNLSSGFGFSNSIYRWTFTNAIVGSRLCFQTEEQSNYAATQFIDIYEQFLTLNKKKNASKN